MIRLERESDEFSPARGERVCEIWREVREQGGGEEMRRGKKR